MWKVEKLKQKTLYKGKKMETETSTDNFDADQEKPFELCKDFTAQFGHCIDELAQLSPIEYDRVRKQEAKRMGIRTETLDKEVSRLHVSAKVDSNTEITEEVIQWDEPIDSTLLADTIRSEITAHVILSEESATAVTLWIMLTYVFDSFVILPILTILSPLKRCGKTNLMTVLYGLANRALMASNISNASIFRIAQSEKPTLLMDEFDTYSKDNENLRGILNSGHNRFSSKHIRCNSETNQPEAFDAFTPKAIAMIGNPKDTIVDRSIIIQLSRKKAGEKVEKILPTFFPDNIIIRRKLKRWANDNIDSFKGSTVTAPDLGNDRMMDNWTPLFAIAEAVGGEIPKQAKESMMLLAGVHADDESIGSMLLEDIKTIFDKADDSKVSSEDIIKTLTEMDDRPWSEWRKGKPMTKPALARQLRKFDIKPKTIRLGSGTIKGYSLEQFIDVFTRYVPDPPIQTVTPSQVRKNKDIEQKQSATQKNDVAVENQSKQLNLGDCCTVAPCNPPSEGDLKSEVEI